MQHFRGIEIKALAACVPSRIVGNDAFESLIQGRELRIFEKSVGIQYRRWAADGTTALDLGEAAAKRLIAEQQIATSDLSALIFLSQTPDYKLPFNSNLLQSKLGLDRELLCLDLNAGCAGFVQGLGTAFALAAAQPGNKVLLVIAETMSRMLSLQDRGTTLLFGDGASALLIENTGNAAAEAVFGYYSDGAHADAIMIPDGGYRNAATAESLEVTSDDAGNAKNRLQLSMDGARVFDFTLREIAPSVQKLLADSGVTSGDVDYFLFHQSNRFIIQQIAAQLGIPAEKALVNIEGFGNTSGVSIPLLMADRKEALAQADTLVCSGYGVGLNWANCLLKNQAFNNLGITEI